MQSVVVDTNVFISAMLRADGKCREVIRSALKGDVEPLMGDKLLKEYEDVLSRQHLFANCPINETERNQLLDAFLSMCRWVPIFFLWRPNLPDEGDNHIVELAVAGNAQIIITQNTRDFNRAELQFLGLQILDPREFLKRK